jgi:hypothetical protein
LPRDLLRQVEYLGSGRHRHAFRVGDVVIKVPHNFAGYLANHNEVKQSRREPDIMAKTRFLDAEHYAVVQEYVRPANFPADAKADVDFPRWVDFIDAAQVGHDKAGNLKAYDFG